MTTPFQKKPNVQIIQANNKLNKLLGIGFGIGMSSIKNVSSKNESFLIQQGILSKQLIIKSAMFWDSKERVDRIKSLMLDNLGLKQFQNTQDFQVQDLASIELLGLSKNQIIHLHPLSVLDTLICLNISHNKIYDLSPLSSLINLQELYASYNQITSISVFENDIHDKLYRLNLYSNKISNLKDLIKGAKGLKSLSQFDIQQNPVWNQQTKIILINTTIRRLNGDLLSKSDKQMAKNKLSGNNYNITMGMSSSNFYNKNHALQNKKQSSSKTQIKSQKDINQLTKKYQELENQFKKIQYTQGVLKTKKSDKKITESMQQSMMIKTSSSFFNKVTNIAQLNKKYEDLQTKYEKIDDEFQNQILKNVQLKAKIHSLLNKKKQLSLYKEQINQKSQQLKQLKRKVKQMKQNLFANQSDKKGQLLRTLFELETAKSKNVNITINSQKKRRIEWNRRFEADDVIIIPNRNNNNEFDLGNMKLSKQDEQINMLLNSNSNTIQQMKRQLAYLTDD